MASNIAEGASRNSEIEFARYLEIALGSAFEVETQLVISYEVGYLSNEKYQEEIEKLQILERKLNYFITKIKINDSQKPKANS